MVGADGLPGLLFDCKTVASRMTDGPQHSHRITVDPFIRRADNTDDGTVEIFHAVHIINDGVILDFVEQSYNFV